MKKLAIIGSYPEGRDLIPWTDEATEIWAFNEAPQKTWWVRWDVCFQLHRPDVYTSHENFVSKTIGADHWDWLQTDHGPDKIIYMQTADARVPNAREYPLDGVLSLIPYRYLRSSIAMALGLAIYQGYQDIDLYGINLVSNTEYGYQANNMCYWIGFAQGRGVNLTMRCWLDEFNQKIYGYEGETQLGQDYFTARARECEMEANATTTVFARIKERLDRAIFAGDCDEVAKLSVDLEAAGMDAGERDARLAEAVRYRDHIGDVPRQEFEYSAAKAAKEGELQKALMYHKGGQLEYVWNVWKGTRNLEARNQVRGFAGEKAKLTWRAGWELGVMRENQRYLSEVDQRILMAGGQHTLTALGKG